MKMMKYHIGLFLPISYLLIFTKKGYGIIAVPKAL